MEEPIRFEGNLVLKEIRPMPAREDGVRQVMMVVSLPERGLYGTAKLIAAFKRELIASKEAAPNWWLGANIFVSGQLAAGMEISIGDKLRNYRNIFRQIGPTDEYVLSGGIDPDPDVEAALTVKLDLEELEGLGRAL